MMTNTEQQNLRAAGPALRDGAAAIVAVTVAGLLLAGLETRIPPSRWHDPAVWSLSAAGAVAVQAALWFRSRRALTPVGVVLLVGVAYATNTYGTNQWGFLAEVPLIWATGVICLVTGLIWELRRSS